MNDSAKPTSTSIRIAHLSDIHLRHHTFGLCPLNKRRGRLMHKHLPIALERIAAARPHFLAITGDLLDVPHWITHPTPGFERDDLLPWHEAILADYQWLKQQLDATGIPYQVVAGNHDYPELMWQVFQPTLATTSLGGTVIACFHDSEHKGNWPRRFYPERDRWEALLSRSDLQPQLHLQHYLISSAHNENYPHGYEESEDMLQRMVAAQKPLFSLSGHLHSGTDLIRVQQVALTAVPAFCEAPFQWRLYDTTPDFSHIVLHPLSLGTPPLRPVVFLDRDGVINTLPAYRQGPKAMELVPGSAQAIRALNEAGYATVIITNQSAVGMGYVPETVLYSVNDKMCRLLAAENAYLDGIYASLSAEEHAVLPRYRAGMRAKPSPDMLHKAASELHLDLSRAWMVGDNVGDIECGQSIGAQTALVLTGNGPQARPTVNARWPAVPVLPDLAHAVRMILEH